MPKILFDAVDVRKLLEANPEVEAELTKNAAAQVAEQFKRKVLDNSSTLVERLINEINSKLNYKYRLPEVVLDVIKSTAQDHFKQLAADKADRVVKDAFDSAIERYDRALEKRLDGFVATAVEKRVALLLRGLK